MNITTGSQRVFQVVNIIFLGLLAFVTFYPFWYVFVASFNEGADFTRGGGVLLAKGLHPGKLPEGAA
jgi:putative aldouronate transport system permease protein